MKFVSSNIASLRDLYTNQLRTLLCVEEELTNALEEMIEKATDKDLKAAFQLHLQETEEQIIRLEKMLIKKLTKAEPLPCNAIQALITEAEDLVKHSTDDSIRDIALIAVAQRIEHFEIAAYGAVRSWARILGETEDANLLDEMIKEEGHADQVLTEIADRINTFAEAA